MKERTLIYLVVVLVVVNVAALGTIIYQRLANPILGAFGPRPTEFDPGIIRDLRLSPEQRQEMVTSHRMVDSLVSPLHDEIQQKRQELFTEMESEQPDTLLVNQLITDIGTLQVSVQKTLVHNFMNASKTLTPDQRKAFLRLMDARTDRMERPMMRQGRGFGRGRK